MKKRFFWLLILPLASFLPLTSCEEDDDVLQPSTMQQPDRPKKAPLADAGQPQVITLPQDSTELVGSGKDEDGTIVSYQWSILAYYSQRGQEATFTYTTPTVKLTNLEEGTYWCTLLVTDNDGLTGKQETIIRVTRNDCPCFPDPCDAFGDPCDPWDY